MATANIDIQKISELSLKLYLTSDWKSNSDKMSALFSEYFPFIEIAACWSYPGDFSYLTNGSEDIFKNYFQNIKRVDMVQSKEVIALSIPNLTNVYAIAINLEGTYLGMLVIHVKSTVNNDSLKILVKSLLPQLSLAKYASMMANEVEKRTSTDKLTGLWNRTYFNERFRDEVERLVKSKEIGAVAIITFDELAGMEKVISKDENESIILKASNVLRKAVRKTDWVVYWDKYEMLVYLNNTQPDSTIDVINRIANQFIASHPLLIPIIGISNTLEVNTARGLIQLSDKRLQLARKDGRKPLLCYAVKEGLKFLPIK
ncbi:MAG: diguanylate cyclase [Candidatus Sericytochromatia bacterium]